MGFHSTRDMLRACHTSREDMRLENTDSCAETDRPASSARVVGSSAKCFCQVSFAWSETPGGSGVFHPSSIGLRQARKWLSKSDSHLYWQAARLSSSVKNIPSCHSFPWLGRIWRKDKNIPSYQNASLEMFLEFNWPGKL